MGRQRTTLLAAVLLLGLAVFGPAASRAETRGSGSVLDIDQYEFAQRYTLVRINQERVRAGAGRVKLDPLVSHSAKLHSEEMLAGSYLSHWNQAGILPTRRYNLLGGYDAVGENVYMQHGQLDSLEDCLDTMLATLMDSPGHRRTILEPTYTHVGLGFALDTDSQDFYASQEFIVKVGGDYSCPLTARVGETVEFSGRFDQYRYELEHVVVGYEEPPVPRERSWLMRTDSYEIGGKFFAGYTPSPDLTFRGMATYHDIESNSKTGWFRCRAVLDYKGRPGIYYLSLWLRDKRSGQSLLAATATVEATD